MCPAYRDNITGKEYQQMVSDGWFKYYGFRIPAEDVYCDGCVADDSEDPQRIDVDCPVRPCVMAKGVANCAHCDEYVCEKLAQRVVNPEEVVGKQKGPVAQEDYDRYIKPYDNKTTLDRIRAELGKSG
jgi:hypothetical protein